MPDSAKAANNPHPEGAEVWERDVGVGVGGEIATTSWSFLWPGTDEDFVEVPRDRLMALLLAAGYEFKGIADGTATCWHEQTEGRS